MSNQDTCMMGVRTSVHVKTRTILFTVGALIVGTSCAVGQNDGHPLIKPYEGSYVEGQEIKEFDEQQLVIGRVLQSGAVKTRKLEGKVTRIDFRDPDNRSSLERMRNYDQALRKAGFEIIYNCNKEECGSEIQIESIGYYPPERYLTAFRKGKEGDVWIGVFVAAGPWTKVRVVEAKPMETGMVKFSADLLEASILKEGHMALYGIYFETGKSDIKPESAETLKEIAAFLRDNPSLHFYVVGHTDNVGRHKDNMDLSSRRAASVVNELVAKFEIPSATLQPEGVGSMAPVATNGSKEGRERNRRVEIVTK